MTFLLGVDDTAIATYTRRTERVIRTQDDDVFTAIELDETAGVLCQKDQTLAARTGGDIVHERSQYVPQSVVTACFGKKDEYVTSDGPRPRPAGGEERRGENDA